jgi:hypothetical protein
MPLHDFVNKANLNFQEGGQKLTLECSKDSCGLGGTASVASAGNEVAEEDCGCDESGEPEEHCQALDTTDDPWVCKAFELPRSKGQVDQGENRPKRSKHQEVDFRRRAIAVDAGD